MAISSKRKHPNLLLITSHDLGNHLGCYGVNTVHSPNIDSLAAEGVRFSNSFCPAPQCSPSRASIHTGRYPQSNGVLGLAQHPFDWALNQGETTLAQYLGAAGWETHLVGFQHATKTTDALGFQNFYPNSEVPPADAACQIIEKCKDNDTSFYIHLNFARVHRSFDAAMDGTPPAKPDKSKGVYVPPYLPQTWEMEDDFADFQGTIRELDKAVGKVLEALRNSGMDDDTLVIFVADHGIAFPRAKCTLFDPGLRTALVMRWPAGGLVRKVEDALISHVDLVPTILDLFGLPIPSPIEGVSLVPYLSGRDREAPRKEIFAQKTFHVYYDPMRAVRTDDYKLILRFETVPQIELPDDVLLPEATRKSLDLWRGSIREANHIELYDLRADPLEQNNLADKPEYANIQQDLLQKLISWMISVNDPILVGPVRSPSYKDVMNRVQQVLESLH